MGLFSKIRKGISKVAGEDFANAFIAGSFGGFVNPERLERGDLGGLFDPGQFSRAIEGLPGMRQLTGRGPNFPRIPPPQVAPPPPVPRSPAPLRQAPALDEAEGETRRLFRGRGRAGVLLTPGRGAGVSRRPARFGQTRRGR